MNKELWEQFKNGERIAINCKTKKEADEFTKLCEKNNIGGHLKNGSIGDNYWNMFKESTCYTNGFDGRNGIGYGSINFHSKKGYKIVTYTELMEDKKTFTGPELAQLLLDKKISEGTKFKDENGFIWAVRKIDGKLGLCEVNHLDHISLYTSFFLINCTFTLIKEPKIWLMYLSQAARENKKIKLKGWKDYYSTDKVLDYLRCEDKETIKEALTKKVWEVEQ